MSETSQGNFHRLDKPICFLHTFKTGGISFGNYLQDTFGEENTVNGLREGLSPNTDKRDPDTGTVSTRHLNYKDILKFNYIRGHIPYSYWAQVPVEEQPYFTTLIRDPIARIVSYYHFSKSWKGYQSERINSLRQNCQSISDFVNLPTYEFNSNLDNFQCKFFSGIEVIDGDIDYARHSEEDYFSMALENLERFYLVGIAELSEISLMLLANKMGLPAPTSTYRINTFEQNVQSEQHKTITREQLSLQDYQVLYERNHYDIQLRNHFITKLNQDYIKAVGLANKY